MTNINEWLELRHCTSDVHSSYTTVGQLLDFMNLSLPSSVVTRSVMLIFPAMNLFFIIPRRHTTQLITSVLLQPLTSHTKYEKYTGY